MPCYCVGGVGKGTNYRCIFYMHEVKSPSRLGYFYETWYRTGTIEAYESCPYPGCNSFYNTDITSGGYINQMDTIRHNGYSNVAFIDGHVENWSLNSLKAAGVKKDYPIDEENPEVVH